jgi:hypothetical protein
MLLAWSFTEVVRYGYFVFTLSGLGVPALLSFLRYNTFMILYPLGISSECWLVYQTIPAAKTLDERLPYVLWAVLAVYVPGSYVLFSHMLRQRSRIQKQQRVAWLAGAAPRGAGGAGGKVPVYDPASDDRVFRKMRAMKRKQAAELAGKK